MTDKNYYNDEDNPATIEFRKILAEAKAKQSKKSKARAKRMRKGIFFERSN